MPELPEVETVARGLNRTVKGRKIVNVWTDWPKYFKLPKSEKEFKKHVIGRRIKRVSRRAKYVLIELSDNHLLVIHQKLTGHLLYGKWEPGTGNQRPAGWEKEKWLPVPFKGPLTDPMNRFIRLIFFLDSPRGGSRDNGKMLAFSDVRRFGKFLCGPRDEVMRHLEKLGPEPLNISFARFKKLFENKRGRIKQVLMSPEFIAGIGNIYADEVLYAAKIHPLSRAEKLKEKELRVLYRTIQSTLKKAIKLRGTSIDDFRDTAGEKGRFGETLKVYQKNGKPCPKGHTIERIVIAGRSAHFCPTEQKLYR